MHEEAVNTELDPASKSDSVLDDRDQPSPPRPASPVPGTSKSSGTRRRSSKEPKLSSPDPVEGDWMLLLMAVFRLIISSTCRRWVFLVVAQRFAGKIVTEITYFVLFNSVSKFIIADVIRI